MEPCLMCAGAILQSRIKTVVYGVPNEKFGCVESVEKILTNQKFNHTTTVVSGVMKEEIEKMLKDFFKQMRNK